MDSSCVFIRGAVAAAADPSAPARLCRGWTPVPPVPRPSLAHAQAMLATCWGSNRCAAIHCSVMRDARAAAAARVAASVTSAAALFVPCPFFRPFGSLASPPPAAEEGGSPAPSSATAVSLAIAHRVLATSCGLNSAARASIAAHTARSATAWAASRAPMPTPKVARLHATLERPCAVHTSCCCRQSSTRGCGCWLALAALLASDVAAASRSARTRGRLGSTRSLAAPQMALESSCGLNLDAWSRVAASTSAKCPLHYRLVLRVGSLRGS
mmetsp:Transcript_41548/g.66631  ORF Transcript_41548/g.66631 Transcript_41548/m.66631 type:complete len:270 (+) Transcript_41548:948-1757(+)